MSKRAEEKALEAYPVKVEWVGNQYGGPADINKLSREKYQQGYEQAEKDFIEKAVKWLKENAGNYWYDDGYVEADEEFLEDFCKAIKDEY